MVWQCKVAFQCLGALAILQASNPLFSGDILSYSHHIGEQISDEWTVTLSLGKKTNFSDFSDCWIVSLINDLIGMRLFSQFQHEFNFSDTITELSLSTSTDSLTTAISHVEDQINMLANTPFTEWELQQAKNSAYAFLQRLYKEDNQHLSSQCSFIDQSLRCLEGVNIMEINEVFHRLDIGDNYHISYALQNDVRNEKTQPVDHHQDIHKQNTINTVTPYMLTTDEIKYLKVSSEDLYHTLQIQQWEVDIIKKIINTMGDKNVMQLLLKQKDLKKMGKKILQVHPLKFLEVIFTDAKTTRAMHEIENNGFKWDAFMNGSHDVKGLAQKLNTESDRNNLLPHLHGFCAVVQVDYNMVYQMASKRDWKKLVHYLIHS